MKVVRTAGTLDPASRTLLTELEADNAKGEILAGSYAQVRFPQAKVDAALTLPSNTLLFRAEGPQVGVVGADGKVALRIDKVRLAGSGPTLFSLYPDKAPAAEMLQRCTEQKIDACLAETLAG